MGKGVLKQKGSVRLTERDLNLLLKLNAAAWLTTGQLRNWFFQDRSTNAVCKRLRRLAASRYVAMVRTSSTEQALYRLASRGKLALIEHSSCEEADIAIPSQLPRKIHHFAAINDLRFCFERLGEDQSVNLAFFFSERELTSHGKKLGPRVDVLLSLLGRYRIMPDAIAGLRILQSGNNHTLNLAIEYDAGTEHLSFFGRTKIRQYTTLFLRGQDLLFDFKVLTYADSIKRIVSLMQQTVCHEPPYHLFYFALRNTLRERPHAAADCLLDPYDFFAPVRRGDRIEVVEVPLAEDRVPSHSLAHLPATLLRSHYLREEGRNGRKPFDLHSFATTPRQGNRDS